MDDSLVRPRSFSPSSIRSQLQNPIEPAPKAENPTMGLDGEADRIDPMPRPGDAYKAHGRPGNKPDLSIYFVTRDFAYRGFSYGVFGEVLLLPGDKPGSSPVLTVRFNYVATEVVIEGRNLHAIFNGIMLHRMPWVWEHPSPKDFRDENATVISKITFRKLEDE
jgi:hypothetical protein